MTVTVTGWSVVSADIFYYKATGRVRVCPFVLGDCLTWTAPSVRPSGPPVTQAQSDSDCSSTMTVGQCRQGTKYYARLRKSSCVQYRPSYRA